MSRSIISSALSTVVLSLVLLLPPSALAQHGGHHGGFGGGYSSGHISGYGGGYGSFRGGYGSFYGGYSGYGGYYNRGFYPRYGYYSRYYGYYGYPRWGFSASFGYGYWPYYDYPYYYWPPRYYYYPTYPQVVTSRSVVPYETPDRTDTPPAAQPASTGRYWLIAFKNDTTLAVTDYWLEDSTLNYVTRQGVKSSVELSKVDLEFTRQLNQERGMEFQLPRPQAQYQPKPRDAYGRAY